MFFLTLIVIVALYFKLSDVKSEKKLIKVPSETCNAQQQICKFEVDNFKLELLFDKNIFYLKKFNVSAWVEKNKDLNIESIQVEFKMKNMNMGINRFILTKTITKNEKQNWQGKALLPVCITGRADWISALEVTTNKNRYIFSIPIGVKRESI